MKSTKKYLVVYSNKKLEDNIIIKNIFENLQEINLGWVDYDFHNNMKIIENKIKEDNLEQIIFSGFEIGWDKLVVALKEKYKNIAIKVLCNTNDSLLYYEYERKNFFKLLELSKSGKIDNIAFFRKGQYETYKQLGYSCSYLLENYKMDDSKKIKVKEYDNNNIDIGIYPLNYTWDKNIFNQLCIAKFIKASNLNYNCLDSRMDDFLTNMKIKNKGEKLEKIDEDSLIEVIAQNDVVIATSFTEYMHPVFFISMELGIPCLIGNNSDFFEEESKLNDYIVSMSEDNPIKNAEMIQKILKNKKEIKDLYLTWKESYNKKSEKLIEEFLNK